MRLINTQTYDLEEFSGGHIPKYAILSHTWGDDEVTLQDYARIRAAAASSQPPPASHASYNGNASATAVAAAAGPPPSGYWKILKACAQARRDGLAHLWCDTNCIDKSSSAELSEAINSMHGWYRHSAACYCFLVDVPPPSQEDPRSPGSAFRRSRWFGRGWTLQELLAPLDAVFFSSGWERLGTKVELAELVREVTSIPVRYLLRREAISGASVAQRMSWVSGRVTSRTEDIAYCMLGIFDVNMPLIYGEGSKAFIRLQEEIIKKSDDHSIFAWTWISELTDPPMKGIRAGGIGRGGGGGKPSPPLPLSSSSSSSTTSGAAEIPSLRLTALRENKLWDNPERSTMLAPDPLNFYAAGGVPVLTPGPEVAPFGLTNAGLSISLPIIRQGDGHLIFAVLHAEEGYDEKGLRCSGVQRLTCLPLVPHIKHHHRYTRTWFPKEPLVLIRRKEPSTGAAGLRGDHQQKRQQEDDSGPTAPEVHTIQVCRDYQQVPFYYRSFGCNSCNRGFWFFYPEGLAGYRVVDGFVSAGGVYSNYGVFFDAAAVEQEQQQEDGSATKPSVAGGIIVLQRPQQPSSRVRLFLAVSALRPDVPVCELVVGGPRNGQLLKDGVVFSDETQLSQSLLEEVVRPKIAAEASDSSSTSGSSSSSGGRRDAECRVMVHNAAPMSHAADSKIFMTEVVFRRGRGDGSANNGEAKTRRSGTFP